MATGLIGSLPANAQGLPGEGEVVMQASNRTGAARCIRFNWTAGGTPYQNAFVFQSGQTTNFGVALDGDSVTWTAYTGTTCSGSIYTTGSKTVVTNTQLWGVDIF